MKFQNEHDEYLWSGSVESGVITGDGDVEAPTGWFAGIDLLEPLLQEPGSDEEKAYAFYGARHLILHESNEGFVTVLTFDTREARDERVGELQRAYALWLAGIQPEEAVAAIGAYRAAALWSVFGSDSSVGIAKDAQHQMRDDVIDYITAEHENIRAYLEVMGEDFQQAGHDFWLLRNGKESLADRGVAGPAVEAVIEAAHAWGPQRLGLNDDSEIEIRS